MDPFSFLFWRLHWFFRDPVRTPPSGRVIVSPADGVVLYVRRIERGEVPNPVKRGVPIPLPEWLGQVECEDAGWLIGVYMTPLSVHYNRTPIPGRIARVVPRPAKRRNLSMTRPFMRLLWGMPPYEAESQYLTENARNTTVIEGELRAVVVQIADAYVSEVDCFVHEGQAVALGEKLGMIRMGSQCDVFLADRPGIQLEVQAGQRVYAGETIFGRY